LFPFWGIFSPGEGCGAQEFFLKEGDCLRDSQKKKFILNVLFLLAVALCLYVFFCCALCWLLPFVLGLAIAFCLKPATEWIARVTRMRRKPSAICAAVLFYTLLGALIWLLSTFLFGQFATLAQQLPDFFLYEILPLVERINRWSLSLFSRYSPEISEPVRQLQDGVIAFFQELTSAIPMFLAQWVAGLAGKIPYFFMAAIFTVVSSVFLCIDYQTVVSFLFRQLPESWRPVVLEVKNFMVSSLFSMGRAYCYILLFTFLEIFAGLWLLRVPSALVIAAIIAFLDILPLIGSGGILIPWALLELLRGGYPLGVGLLILYGIVTVVRNAIEPKLVGQEIGLHPLATITAMFLGLNLAGFGGMLTAPLAVLLIKHLNEEGIITLYRP
jgi:sporulation integral membrane protein YtvI